MKLGHYEFHRPAAASLRAQATRLRSFARFVMWCIVASFSLLIACGLTVGVLVQTEWFHRWAAQKLTAVLSDELEAKLEFSSIRFNIFKGVELDSIRLQTRGDTLLRAGSLRISYELEPLLIKNIVISEVLINDADIRLLRSRMDSSWNVDHIVKPTPDNPNKKALDWGISVRNVALTNARLRVHDSLSFEPIANRLHYTRLQLDSLNLSLSATLNLAAKQYAVSIDDFRALENRCALRIEHLRCAAEIDSSHIVLRNLRFITPESDLRLHGTVDSTNVFDASTDMATRPLHLHIEPSHLKAEDLNLFLPPDFSLASEFDLHTSVEGSLTVMRFDVEKLRTQSTELHGHYTMHNVANSKPFVYEIELRRSLANYSELRRALPTLKLGEIDFLDHLRLDGTRVYGTKDSIAAQLGIEGDFGSVQGNAILLPRSSLGYQAELELGSFDAYPFTKSYSSASRLNGHLSVKGSGTTLEDLNSQITLALTRSSFGAKDFNALLCAARVQNSVVSVDTLAVRFPLSAADSLAGYGEEDVRELRMHATLNLQNKEVPSYDAHLITQQFPLARLINDNSLPQALSADVNLRGSGFHPDSIQCQVETNVRDFILSDGALFPFKLNASLQRMDAQHRVLELHSDFADAKVEGRYRLGTAWNVFLVHVGMIDRYVRRHYAVVQSDTSDFSPLPPYGLPNDTLDLRYNLRLRGMAVIAPFIKGIRLDGRGSISGSISGSPSCYQFVVDSAKVRRFSMRIDKDFVYSQPIVMSMRVQTENMTSQPYLEQAHLSLRCDSVFRLNATRFVRPAFEVDILDDHARFTMSTRMENHIPLYARGSMHSQGRNYLLQLDSMNAGWSRSFVFNSTGPSTMHMSPAGVRVDSLELRYLGGDDRIAIDGLFNASEFRDMNISVRRFDVATLKRVQELSAINALQMLEGVVDTLGFVLNGPYRRPTIKLSGRMSDIRYNEVAVGVQALQGEYDGKNVRAQSSVTALLGDSVKTLSVDVRSLPLDISLSPATFALRDNEVVDIAIDAKKLSLAAVSPFIPGISNLDGRGDAQMSISGTTPDRIDYSGTVRFDNAQFLVPATKINYTAGGRLSLKNTTVSIDSIRVNNVESDLTGGAAFVKGQMHIRGFSIEDLDIYASVSSADKFLVMSDATQSASDFMYGRTLISTQDNDKGRTQRSLHFHGTPERPLLDGFVMIEDAEIKFPPTIDRKTRTSSFVYRRAGSKYLMQEEITVNANVDTTIGDLPPEEPIAKLDEQKLAKTFIDILRTEVTCKINNYMTVTMDFGINDQMVAIVRQDNPLEAMKFVRIGSESTSLKSDLIVDPATTYKFYSNFNASGKMNIDGPIDNPKLNLVATLKQERTVNDRKGTYQVDMTITGTKKEPKLKMNYWIDGREHDGAVTPDEITTNAILLTMFGYTQSELSGNSGHVGSTVSGSVLSSPVGAILSNALQGRYIKNVNVDFANGVTDLSQAHLKITAQYYGSNITLGGTLSDPTVTVEYPLGHNALLSYMKATSPGSGNTRQQKQGEFKIGVHFP